MPQIFNMQVNNEVRQKKKKNVKSEYKKVGRKKQKKNVFKVDKNIQLQNA